MTEVFISYARSAAAQADVIAKLLKGEGHEVWWDADLPPNRDYADVIEERLNAAKAVVVIWSAESVKSQWVRSEADKARTDGKLIQVAVDESPLPMPFDRLNFLTLIDWQGEQEALGWRKLVSAIAELTGAEPMASPSHAGKPSAHAKLGVCVLPFANMSDDPQQEYFSDGISEDVITDLSKISALLVIARNTAFAYKGKNVDVPSIARQLNVGYVLEGSVRKAAGRVRINAQLIDVSTGGHIWAERYDRELDDIFALQDEISLAIVDALKLKLLPTERKAIVARGTENAEAYNLFLMARRQYISSRDGDARGLERIVRLCERATAIDPAYARAWALLSLAQTTLHFIHGRTGSDGLDAADQALSLDPNLAEAHAIKARHLWQNGNTEAAEAEIGRALALDPESFEANTEAGRLNWVLRRFREAADYFGKSTMLDDTSVSDPGMLLCALDALADEAGVRRAAAIILERAERALAKDDSNGSALSFGVNALGVLGELDRAAQWIDKALLLEPDNMAMRYNFGCFACARLHDLDRALELLGPVFETMTPSFLQYARLDADLDPLRGDPRFTGMLEAANKRLATAAGQ